MPGRLFVAGEPVQTVMTTKKAGVDAPFRAIAPAFFSDHPVTEIGGWSLLRIWWRRDVFLGSIGFQFVEEVAHMLRVSLGRRGALGFFGDTVADVVEQWIKLAVEEFLMRICRRPEPQVVHVHERDQVAEACALDGS
jgi:hypothetical protein